MFLHVSIRLSLRWKEIWHKNLQYTVCKRLSLFFFGARFFFFSRTMFASAVPCSLTLTVLPKRSTYACRFVLIPWYFSIVRHNFICKRNQTLFNELCLHTSIHPFGNTSQSLRFFYPWQNRFFFFLRQIAIHPSFFICLYYLFFIFEHAHNETNISYFFLSLVLRIVSFLLLILFISRSNKYIWLSCNVQRVRLFVCCNFVQGNRWKKQLMWSIFCEPSKWTRIYTYRNKFVWNLL